VVASVDTYLRFAEATNRLDLYEKGGKDLPEMIGELSEKGASGKSKGLLSGAKEALLGRDDEDNRDGRRRDEDEDEKELEEARPRRRPAKKAAARRRRTEE
jgi:hypothetical protein